MHISFSPVRHDEKLELSRAGDVLTINGAAFDFSGVPDGATLPQDAVDCAWLASDVTRLGGRLHLTLILPHGANAPAATLFPDPMVLVEDGPVTLPAHDQTENTL